MSEQGLLDVLRRSGGLVAVATQLDIAPPLALAAATALLPMVRGGFRRRVEQADDLDAGLNDLLAWLAGLGGGTLASAVLQNVAIAPEAGRELVTGIFGPEQSAVAVTAAELSQVDVDTVQQVLPLLAMLAGGYVWARAGRMSPAERLAELGPLLGLGDEPNPLDALTGIADQRP
ncbi:MAG: DUF937 domain-containing protein [Novosphingobium sp.]|jgi:hypothetical protein|uniref:DUF937 domain-containing protein n=1 Tax=Novosphingobium sp. TaxID=1874826 RepID=UPI003918B94E|nr:DUF937 domain-containing protein [Novosphingobium sp.]